VRARLPLVVVLVALLGQVGLGWLACDLLERGDQVVPPVAAVACADADGGAPGSPCEHGPLGGERSAGAVVRALDAPPVGYVVARVSVERDGAPARADEPPVPAAVRAPVAVLGVDRN
jgi:hypothetical protein